MCRNLKALVVLSVLLVSCGIGLDGISDVDVADLSADYQDASFADVADDIPVPTDMSETEQSDLVFFETMDSADDDSGTQQCAPGAGCFLDPCTGNDDCLSGWCVDNMGENVCSAACQTECPPGWSCQQVAGTDPDVVFICISDFSNLCRPCANGNDCKNTAGSEDVCVDYGQEGSFCGGQCSDSEDCPWGFSCVDATTTDGVDTTQCVADAGVCPCTGKSITLALWTPCEVENESGICAGKRICTDEGLSDCNAPVPTTETCNGVDDNCDGDTDEETCNDGNSCTADSCQGADGCSQAAIDGGECLDGNPCTVADHCEAGVCIGQAVDCDDKNPCSDDACDEAGGCIHDFNQAQCDDQNPCTVADQCDQGSCAGVAINCACQEDADCVALEDGDVCNGTLFCDTKQLPYQCAVSVPTIIICPEPEGVSAICLEPLCDPDTGDCLFAAVNEGLSCHDGNFCTIGDTCQDGVCTPGAPANCNDGNLCTDDSCDADTGCLSTPNSAICNDGNVCTTADICTTGECLGGPALNCDDNNLCTGTESCDPQTGCTTGQPLVCDNNNVCDGSEGCHPETGCIVGIPMGCDDGNICNGEESCDPLLGCKAGIPLQCPPGDNCTIAGSCDPDKGCVGGQPIDCDDHNPCTADSCNPDSGCVYGANDIACDDSNACTLNDQCVDSKCKGTGGLLSCNDANPCTTDSCDPEVGCLHILNEQPCNDQDVCTINDHCHLGECIGGGQLACSDSNPCTADSCHPDNGCQFLPADDGDCDDGTECTLGDHCVNGLCVPTGFLDCTDANFCTDDSCDDKLGCFYPHNSLPCDDDNACTANDICGGGVCAGPDPVVCNDGNLCTDDSCSSISGCVFADNEAGCDDKDLCTPIDKCTGGVCVGTGEVSCDDQELCTDDSCEPDKGCVNSSNVLDCDDSNACTLNDVCGDGICQPGADSLACDDSEFCTEDTCDEVQGCLFTPLADNTDCDNGKTCQNGVCMSPCPPGSQTFSYTGNQQTFVMPAGCTTVQIEAWGAQGGNRSGYSIGGKGGKAAGTLTTTPGATLYLYVGQYTGVGTAAGWNGGGQGDLNGHNEGGGGGGASDVRMGGSVLTHRVIVAAGGGGGGGMHQNDKQGGAGGGDTGSTGNGACPGHGATQNAGGTKGTDSCNDASSSDGSIGQGGAGGSGGCGAGGGGGGGGGWYGGGGGGSCGSGGSGGGGGSSYLGGVSDGTTQPGVQSGHGKVALTWP
jgi:hypothetical protein